MEIEAYLDDTVAKLGSLYQEMATSIKPPVFVDMGGYKAWRYETHSDSLACFLKGVRAVSTLNACLVLLRSGYTQEIGALCRMMDDYCNEIVFLLTPLDGDNLSKDQMQFLDDFYQEELDRPTDAFGSTQKRSTVSARKIHAAYAKVAKSEMNPSDAQELLRTKQQALSGYVHGAYPHIMEMFGGAQPHLEGMRGTPRITEWRAQLIGYVYRTIMMSVFVTRKLALEDIEEGVRRLLERFETDTECKSDKTAEQLVANMKRKTT